MNRTTVIAMTLLLTLAAAAGAVTARTQEANGPISWFSQRIVAMPGHPIRMHPHYDLAPGPLVVWFVRDEFNRATCLAFVAHQGTGQLFGPTTVNPKSCASPGR